jgi:hypothetical protein
MAGRRLRISLRLALLLMLLVGAGLGWFNVSYLQPFRAEAAAGRALRKAGGTVYYLDREPRWFWQLFGEKYSARAESVVVSDTKIGDELAPQIAALTSLRALEMDRSQITDAGLQQLGGLVELRVLKLRRLPVKQVPLRRMSHLLFLDLAYTEVANLNLSTLNELETLDLRATRVGDETLETLVDHPRLRTLDVSGNDERPMKITDRGIEYLTRDRLPKLSRVYLYHTRVSDKGVSDLEARFPGAVIYRDDGTEQK